MLGDELKGMERADWVSQKPAATKVLQKKIAFEGKAKLRGLFKIREGGKKSRNVKSKKGQNLKQSQEWEGSWHHWNEGL